MGWWWLGDTGDVALGVAYWLPWVKVERRGWPSGSNLTSETTIGTDGSVLVSLSGSGEEAESNSLGSKARDGEGGGG